MALEQDYDIVGRLGEGAFGKVYKAKHRASGDVVAIKQIKLGAKSWDEALKSTELAALRDLRHPFIVRLRELIRSQLDGSLYYIFEFIGSDLCRLIRQHPQGMEESQAAELQRQIFAGLAHTHHHNFFHRDIKPENILYDEEQNTVRIADYGEARSLRARPPFTDYVGTRWYRAPECLLRDRSYSSPVDVWAAGLVFAELLRGSPVFCGTGSIDQLYKIFQVLGQPLLTEWPEFQRLADACRFRVPDRPGCGLPRILPRASAQAQAFAAEVLKLNPRRRPLARKCLEHAFFARCPPLDLNKAEAFREARGFPEGYDPRPDTCRSQASGVSAATSVATGASAAAGAAGSPQAAVADEAEPPPALAPPGRGEATPPRTPSPERKPQGSTIDDFDLGLDLDAELDKILNVGSPRQPAPPSRATPVSAMPVLGHASSRAALHSPQPVRSSPSPVAANVNAGVFDGPATTSRPPSAKAPQLSTSRSLHVAREEERPAARPASPGHGSVDALFDSLCADLGVEPEDEGRAPGSSRRPSRGFAFEPAAAPPIPMPPRLSAKDLARDSSPEDAESEVIVSGHGSTALAPASIVGPSRSDTRSPPLDAWSGFPDSNAEQGERHSDSNCEERCVPPLQLPGSGHRGSVNGGKEGGEAPWGESVAYEPSRRPASAVCRPVSCASLVDAPRTAAPSRSRTNLAVQDLPADQGDQQKGRRCDPPWTVEESLQLRRAVKRVVRRGDCDRDALWVEVSRELGGPRGPRECKRQYARDYRAHRAGGAASREDLGATEELGSTVGPLAAR